MASRTRSRPYIHKGITGIPGTIKQYYNDNGELFSVVDVSEDVVGKQITVSSGHAWPPRKSGFHGDIGGDFSTTKYYIEKPGSYIRARGRTSIGPLGSRRRTEWFEGNVCPYHSSLFGVGKFPAPLTNAPSNGSIDSWGAEAVARCKPTNSAANAGTALGELFKDGLPSLIGARTWQSRALTAKNAGDEYLNAQFGWMPLVNDIGNFVSAMRHIGSIVDQFNRDSGRLVRRRYTFPDESSSSESTIATTVSLPQLTTDYRKNSWNSAVKRTEVLQRKWFSGAFTYHAPDSFRGSGVIDTIRSSADRFGISLTPELLWELAPWSWAADWFTNAGDVITNISDSQRYGLVMPYGYMMVNTISRVTLSPTNWKTNPDGATIGPSVFVTESKTRRRANPFGFGVTDSSLEEGQIAILAALGLSRSR